MSQAQAHQQDLEQLERTEIELVRNIQEYCNLVGVSDCRRLLDDVSDRLLQIQIRAALESNGQLDLQIDTRVRT